MPGTLYVVATPIGNLEDVTLRALRVLREVSVIAAEDTRRTARLLQHYSISTPTTSLHEHNEHVRSQALIDRLIAGESIALVSDAGTPVVSDPGVGLVAAAHAHGVRVEPVPGPNAAVAAVSAAGIPSEGFLFAGFPPARAKARKDWLGALQNEPRTLVLYEAPHRILATLADIASVLGNRTVAIARELTKSHEQLAVRPIMQWLELPPLERGEFTLVISGWIDDQARHGDTPTDAEVAAFFGHKTENDAVSRREALRSTAEHFRMRARDVFAAIDREKYRSEDIK